MAGIFDTSIFDYNIFDNTLTYKIIKISPGEAVVKVTGLITVTINPNQLITKQYKRGSITSGSNIFTLSSASDAVGLVVGGTVTDLNGITTTITNIGKKQITLADNMPVTDSDITFLVDTQIVTADSYLDISKLYFSTDGVITVTVNGQPEYIFKGTDHWDFNNMICRFSQSYPVQVSCSTANSVLVMELRKSGDWGTNQNSYGQV